jgi:hypothetical protein
MEFLGCDGARRGFWHEMIFNNTSPRLFRSPFLACVVPCFFRQLQCCATASTDNVFVVPGHADRCARSGAAAALCTQQVGKYYQTKTCCRRNPVLNPGPWLRLGYRFTLHEPRDLYFCKLHIFSLFVQSLPIVQHSPRSFAEKKKKKKKKKKKTSSTSLHHSIQHTRNRATYTHDLWPNKMQHLFMYVCITY